MEEKIKNKKKYNKNIKNLINKLNIKFFIQNTLFETINPYIKCVLNSVIT